MLFKDFSDNEYKINLAKYKLILDGRLRSKLFIEAVNIVKEVYPSDYLCAEVYIPCGNTKLYIDLFLPLRKIAIEVQGEQHYKFNRYMFKNKLHFNQSRLRDIEKRNLLEHNNIKLVYFDYNEKDKWKNILITAYQD